MRNSSTQSDNFSNTKRAASDAVNKIRDIGEETADNLKDAAFRAGRTVNDTYESATEDAANLRDRIAHDAASTGRRIYDGATQNAESIFSSVDRYVGRNPVGALVAALGVGLVVGLLARR